jgi:hypothetical protein
MALTYKERSKRGTVGAMAKELITDAQREQLARRRAAMNEPVPIAQQYFWHRLGDTVPEAPAEPQQMTAEQASNLTDAEYALVRQRELGNLDSSSFGEVKPDLNALRNYASQVTRQPAMDGSAEAYAAERAAAGIKATGVFGQSEPGERALRSHRSSWR